MSTPVVEPDPLRRQIAFAAAQRWWASRPAMWRAGALTYAATQAVLVGWWIAFYPGTLSYDSIMYVWQVSTSNWTTQHSVLYDSLVWLALQGTGQLAILSLAQTVAMAAGLAYAVVGLTRLGVRAWWLMLAAVAAVCLPVVGTFSIYLVKDVAFGVTQVWLLGTVARMLASRPHARRPLWIALLAEFVLMGLLRQNGFVVIALTAAGMALVLSGVRWRILLAGGAAIAVSLIANLAVYPAAGVRPTGSELLLGPVYADLAVAYADRPAAFTDADTRLLATVAPLSYWRDTANCYNADSTVTYGNNEFNFAAASQHQGQLLQLWLDLGRRIPGEMVGARLCRGFIAWSPVPAPVAGRTVKVPITGVDRLFDFPRDRIDSSPFRGAIRSAPLSDTAHRAATWLRHGSDVHWLEWMTWRGATWCYLAYLAVALFAWRRRDIAALALITTILATQLNVLINNPGQLVRYMAAPIFLGILLLPLMFARPAPRTPNS